MIKRYLPLIIGIFFLIIGFGFMLIPFIPIGYILIFIGAFFLASYIPPFKKLLDYLRKKDKSGILDKIQRKVQAFKEYSEEENESEEEGSQNGQKDKPGRKGRNSLKTKDKYCRE